MLTRGSTGGRVGQDPSEAAPLAPTDHAYAAAVATAAAARAAHLKTIEVVPDQVRRRSSPATFHAINDHFAKTGSGQT